MQRARAGSFSHSTWLMMKEATTLMKARRVRYLAYRSSKNSTSDMLSKLIACQSVNGVLGHHSADYNAQQHVIYWLSKGRDILLDILRENLNHYLDEQLNTCAGAER